MGLILLWAHLVRADDVCLAWGEAGALTDADVEATESSGVVASSIEDGLYYTLDDSGGAASLYMFDETGAFRGEQLIQGATNTDWEDLASGPCPAAVDANACLYIADIGDNHEERDSVTLWVVPESRETIVDAVACPLTYPDGPHDAETLLVVPADGMNPGAVRIASKENDGEARIYEVDALTCGATPDVLQKEAKVTLDGPATGGTMTSTTVVIRTLSSAWVWQDCTIGASTWDATPEELDLGADPQGEAIGVTSDGGFITTSESTPFRFRLIPCAETGSPKCAPCGCATGSTSFSWVGGVIVAWGMGRRARRSPTGRAP